MDPREKPSRLDERAVPSPNPLEGMEPAELVPVAETPAPAAANQESAEGPETIECPFCGNRFAAADRCGVCGWRTTLPPSAAMDALRSNARLGYILQAMSVFGGCTSIIAVVVAYSHRNDARGSWLESHYEWQIETFWKGLWMGILVMLAGAAGQALLGGGILGRAPGLLAGAALAAWLAFRVVKGWTRLADDDPVTEY